MATCTHNFLSPECCYRSINRPFSTLARFESVHRLAPCHRLTPAHRPRNSVLMMGGIGDELADFIQAGPKLRKWYGETDKLYMPKDGEPVEEPQEEDDGTRDAILVTDADSPMGELVVLQLVLGRQRIKLLVKDAAKAKTEFGPYVEITQGTVNDGSALKKAMKNCRAVVIAGATGQAARAAAKLGLRHVVLLTAKPAGGLLSSLFKGDNSAMEDSARGPEVQACGIAYTIIRCGRILDRMGGNSYIEFSQADDMAPGELTREDAALIAVRSLAFPPTGVSGVVFSAGSAGAGQPPEGDDWRQMFGRLKIVDPVMSV